MNLKRLFLHNWEAKLVCLFLATVIWWVLRYYVITGTSQFAPLPAPPQEPARK